MIFGIGFDLVEIDRVRRSCERQHFLEKVYTEKEREEIMKDSKRAASDFAGKEAVVKMFGTGFSAGISADDIEILRKKSGQPYVILYGAARKFAQENGIQTIHISITNTKELAGAYVIGEME